MKTNMKTKRELNFDKQLKRFERFCKKYGRLPKGKHNKIESRNYDFMYNHKDVEEVRSIVEYYKKSRTERMVEELKKFCEKEGRLPKLRGPEAEKRLYIFYNKHRDLNEVGEIINHFKFSFYARLGELEEFCKKYEMLPRSSAKDGEEKRLYKFYTKYNDRNEIISLIEKYPRLTFQNLKAFCETKDRFPVKGNSLIESRLYNFWYVHKDQKKYADLREQYRQTKSFRTITELKTFCEENGRMPSSKGNKYEKSLYDFYHKHKNEEDFIEIFSRFGRIHKSRSRHSFEELEAFCIKYNRMPSAKIKEEKPLYDFYYNNRKEDKFTALYNKFCRKELSACIQEFFDNNGRFPIPSSQNEEEHYLGEKLKRDVNMALRDVQITLTPIVSSDFEKFTMPQQCEILSILGFPESLFVEACSGKKKATLKSLQEVFRNHGAELKTKEGIMNSCSFTEINRIKKFSAILAEYKADPHSPYLINESINNLWDIIITESKHGSTSTYDAFTSDTERTEFFNIVRDQLVEEYTKAIKYVPSSEYSGKYDPDLMQRLCIIRLHEKRYYANWSKTGTGKTLQSLLSSLDINSKITLYVLPNSTVFDKAGTKKKEGAIKEFIPNSNVIIYNGRTSLESIIPSERNYILVNYDKLSRQNYLIGLEDLARKGKIDFICVDEIQMAKSRGDKAASNRNKALLALRRLAEDCNPNLYVLGLTATPVINNLYEVKTLCEIITGKSLDDDGIFNGNMISFAAAQTAHKYIINYGFRYNHNYSEEITENETIIPILGNRTLYKKIKQIDKKYKNLGKTRRGMSGIKELEDSQIILKLEACKQLIKPGVILYTQYVGGIKENNTITIINKWLRQNGLDSVLYTGQTSGLIEDEDTGELVKIREEELQRFIGNPKKGIIGSNKSKVLLASSVLRTGVDGLQNVSNTIIMLSLPWTYADYEQLKGRLIRRNSKFNEVNIYIPTVSLGLRSGNWSWDRSKWEILQYKKDLSDLVIFGNYCDSNILKIAQNETEQSLIERTLNEIGAPLEIYSEEIHPNINYHEVKSKLEMPGNYKKPKGSCITHIHQRYNNRVTQEIMVDMASTERGGSMTDYWNEQDKVAKKAGYVDPNTETANLINDIYGGPNKKVADLGCGPHDPLRKLVTNCEEFFSCTFEPEEIPLPIDVVRCDSTRLDMVEDKYFDIANHTNSHWGSNLEDYVLEDYRILKDNGILIITSVCPSRRNKYKIIANAYLESGLWEYLVEPVRFGGKSGMTRGIFKKKGI